MKPGTSRLLLIILLFSMIVSLIPPITPPTTRAAGNTWYVSKTGNDATGDGSIGNPYASIQKAMNESGNGDTIYLRAGNYNNIWENIAGVTSGWEIKHSGTSSNQPFILAGYPGETIILDGDGYSFTEAYGILTVGRLATHYHNVTIRNLWFKNSSQCALCAYSTTASGPCNDIRIENCNFYNIYERAIWIYAEGTSTTNQYQNLLVRNCTFDTISNLDAMGECNTFSYCRDFEISNNTFRNCKKIHIGMASGCINGEVHHNNLHLNWSVDSTPGAPYGSGESIYIDSCSYHGMVCSWIRIHNNTIWGTGTPDNSGGNYAIALCCEIAGGIIHNITIENNIINRTAYDDTSEYGFGIGIKHGDIRDVTIRHNTICMNHGNAAAFYSLQSDGEECDRITVANNIFIMTHTTAYCAKFTAHEIEDTNLNGNSGDAFYFFNNLYYRTDGTTKTTDTTNTDDLPELTAIIDNPEFVDRADGNFHLNITSPAINTASSTYACSKDHDGTTRPVNVFYDIGAYEFTGVAPTVTTNTTTSIGSIHAVINGAILDNGTIDIISYGFEYGVTPSFGSVFISYGDHLGPFSQGAYFSAGQKYYIRAFATNSYATGYGSTLTFVTQPYPPVSITGTSTNATTVVLTWAKGTGANYTRIQRATAGYPSDIGDGSNIYNGTASLYSNTGLTPGTLYYFSSWSMTKWGTETKWNSTSNSSTYTLTRPEPPTSLIGNQCANLTHTWVNWTNGTGKDYNVVVKKVGGIPGTPADGTVIYNGTDNHTIATVTSGDNNYFRVWSLAKEITPSTSAWSVSAPYVSISGILPGSIVTIHPGVYFSIGNTNYSVGSIMNFTQVILTSSTIQFNDTNFSTVPTPSSTKVNVTLNFLHEDTTMTIPGTLLINMSVDTPVSTVPIAFGVQGLHADMTYIIYHNSINDSTAASDLSGVITFTNTSGAWDGTTQYYEIYFMHGGAYGGLTVNVYNETDKLPLIFNCTIVNHSGSETIVYRNHTGALTINMATLPKGEQVAVIIDARNHEMRTYYLDIVPGLNYNLEAYLPYTWTPLLPTNITYLYYFTVIDERGYTISNVRYSVYGLVNYTSYELMQDGYSDGNGKFDVWLLPGKLYKFTLSKTGYENDTYDYITGTTDYTHIFKLLYATGGTTTPYFFYEQVHVSGYMDNTTSILYVNYTDDMGMTTNCQFYIYEINRTAGTSTLFFTYITTGDSDFTFNTPCNNSNDYEVVYRMNHTYFGYKTGMIMIHGWFQKMTTPERFNQLFVINFGYNPFGWSNVITWFIMVGCFFSFNRRDSYMAMILAGFFLLIINFYIGFNTLVAGIAGGAIPIIMILFGILMLIRDRYRFGVDM